MSRRPKTSDVLNRLRERTYSGFDVQAIGYADELRTEVLYTDQDKRLNFHILGAPGQGKSKFIELLAEWNIGREPILLIDSTEGGKTANNLVKHCYLKGWKKVCIIDPSDFKPFNAVPILKPLKLKFPCEVSVNNISDVMRVLWDRQWEVTTRVERYMPAVLHALWTAKLTLAELPFLLHQHFALERAEILSRYENQQDSHRMSLLAAYRPGQYDNHFLPTFNTLNPLTESHIRLLIGSHKKGIPWSQFLKERYVIILNLNPRGAWGDDLKSRKLLGTLIISELIYALSRMVARGWKSPVSMYVDEVGHYATPKLANILNHQRHLNLRLTLAHQTFGQIKNDEVLEAILTSAQNKALFYTPNQADRELLMQNMGYGGDISEKMLIYNLAQLERQKAAVKIGRNAPVYVRIQQVNEPNVSASELKTFKEQIYKQPWYAPPNDINQEINARFPPEQYAPAPLSKRTAKRPPTPRASADVEKQSPPKNYRRPAASPIPDDSPNRETVLQPQKERRSVKIPWD